jgi:hypothetical protein
MNAASAMIQGARNTGPTPIIRTLYINAPAPCSIVRRIVAEKLKEISDFLSSRAQVEGSRCESFQVTSKGSLDFARDDAKIIG